MRAKQLYVNGEALDEPYVRYVEGLPDGTHEDMMWQADHLLPQGEGGPYVPTRDTWGPLLVPDGHCFMLGDNRDESQDSRYWGPLEAWRIEGRAFLIYFSYNKESYRPFPWLREIRWSRIGERIR
jgi:signal peptidase I